MPRLLFGRAGEEGVLQRPRVVQGKHAIAGVRQRPRGIEHALQDGVEVEARVDVQARRAEPRQAVPQRLDFSPQFVFAAHCSPRPHRPRRPGTR